MNNIFNNVVDVSYLKPRNVYINRPGSKGLEFQGQSGAIPFNQLPNTPLQSNTVKPVYVEPTPVVVVNNNDEKLKSLSDENDDLKRQIAELQSQNNNLVNFLKKLKQLYPRLF
jgi:hypothetical protein